MSGLQSATTVQFLLSFLRCSFLCALPRRYREVLQLVVLGRIKLRFMPRVN
ncbi:hypothetical protein M758_11G107500 [Ceratodon purpureus]|uniref:Uncharacterized protein n=1 Tax=Ceratodon purpureus TaxID=3225 RepID=A0A8T0GJC9_CERPU|nr:hypothetical protein KC19_11G112200 [Ceratodon purpureus]KAG0601400.1 hypothetical protein M758_11G107500 [Ceratodon purpureus]